jgi:hypothetical protein
MIKRESGDRSIDGMEVVEQTRIYQKRVHHLFVDKGEGPFRLFVIFPELFREPFQLEL